MKTITTIVCALFLSVAIKAQSGALELINQYAGQEGYTTISISKSLFRMLSDVNKNDPDYDRVKDLSNKLNHFKLLTAEDGIDASFKSKMQKIMNSLDRKGYEELISVQEGKNSLVKISVLERGNKIKELVLSVLGEDDAVLMVINGDFTLDEIMEVADAVEIDGLDELKNSKKS